MTDRRVDFPNAAAAEARLGEALFGYLLGGARDRIGEDSLHDAEFAPYRLIPRVMTGAATRLEMRFFGKTIAAPLVIGAFAGDRVFHDEGLLPIVRAARGLHLPMVVSEETVTPFAELTALHDMLWLQLRAAGPVERICRLIDMAADQGAQGIVLTVLAPTHPVAGFQPGGYSIGVEIARRGWTTIGSTAPGVEPLPSFPQWDWTTLAEAARHAASRGLPLMTKGILHPEDAHLAERAGAGGVIVSNIGMRQSGRWQIATRALGAVAGAHSGLTLHDGGLRNGTDLVIAAALGADLAVTARPVAAALVAGGEGAVRDLLSSILDGAFAMAAWCGVETLGALTPDHIAETV